MRDYSYRGDDGREMPVSEMATDSIIGCLGEGFLILGGESDAAIRERLRIELLIRELGLR